MAFFCISLTAKEKREVERKRKEKEKRMRGRDLIFANFSYSISN